MRTVNQHYIGGKFVDSHGRQTWTTHNPTTGTAIGTVTLGDEVDTRSAVGAAQDALAEYSHSSIEQRSAVLHALHEAVASRAEELTEIMIEEFGGTRHLATALTHRAAQSFLDADAALRQIDLREQIGQARVNLVPMGVAGLITPWNASTTFICGKLAMALAAGCTAVIKPSEMSGLQTQALLEALDTAQVPPGLFNVVHGRGDVVGAEITRNPNVAKISFTGSTSVGMTIARDGAATMKRVTLELGGKSPNILLDDVNFNETMPVALGVAFFNSGQGCLVGSRLLVPEHRLDEAEQALLSALDATVKVGPPSDPSSTVGPMVSERQYDRVQSYIRAGLAEGAKLLAGGEGRPEGLEHGFFVKPTVFTGVTNDMTIAREEIFGPVLSVLTYRDEDEAVEIANDTDYGLAAYVSSADAERARRIASRIRAGRVCVGIPLDEPAAPFGGFKLSGLGREYGTHGVLAFLETQCILG